jgi:Zn-dependent protease
MSSGSLPSDPSPNDPHANPPQSFADPSTTATSESASAGPSDLQPAAASPLDPVTAEVARALESPLSQRTWLQTLALLAFTLVIFAMAGFFENTPIDLAVLVGVLLFHESGHYLGMRLFNYQDVRMFFIPFFGAAVTGRSTSVEGYKEAIVLLAGPLPGIILGMVLGIVCMFYDSAILRSATLMLLFINGFNLLPLLPLDGGRLMHLIVFSRQRHLEAAFRVITALLLGLCAWALDAWLLAGLAVFMLMGTRANYLVSKLAQQLRGPLQPGSEINLSDRIPPEQALPLIERVRQTFPTLQAGALTGLVRQVWERMHLRPPGLAASLLLLAIYFASFVATPIAAVMYLMPLESIASQENPDGSVSLRQEVRVWGRVRESTDLGPDGKPHGRHIENDPLTGQLRAEGQFFEGERDGVWTFYDSDGQVELRQAYRRGEEIPLDLPAQTAIP